jgi:RNA polymerase sigma-54 factor
MVLLQPRLNVRLSQKQILTPGLVQMVSVLALNKLELKDMINAEMMENPVLEELDSSVPLLDEVAGKEESRDRESVAAAEEPPITATVEGEAEPKSDPFEEIDFGSFFKDYLDPGYRSPESEFVERPSFENFLSSPTTLTEHLMWQLGAINVRPEVREAAELVIGNLNEDGYLIATDEEIMSAACGQRVDSPLAVAETEEEEDARKKAERKERHAESQRADDASARVDIGANYPFLKSYRADQPIGMDSDLEQQALGGIAVSDVEPQTAVIGTVQIGPEIDEPETSAAPPDAAEAARPEPPQAETEPAAARRDNLVTMASRAPFTLNDLHEAIAIVRQMDPVGVASRDLRECLLAQLEYLKQAHADGRGATTLNGDTEQVLGDAIAIVANHLKEVQNKQHKEIAKALGGQVEGVMRALDFLKTLDPKPGLRYNKVEPRLIEPDVAFVKHAEEYVVLMNDEDVPQLRLSPTYKRLLSKQAADKDVRGYVKERYKSAIQLIKNIEQRKQTILKVCYAILGRQRDFLDKGIDQLKPMMIKEVAEEIGVHPSTVSRAVANKYAHTPQGVFELRYFFSESVNGPEGGGTPLLILKRRVKKLIEEEDPARPLTDEQITRVLQSQGIQVTRRTVAKYREDMKIPSTHQRRVKS